MTVLDQRLLRVSVEVSGVLRIYEDLQLSADIVKFANATQNEATIKMTNLTKEVRDYLLTETSQFNANRTPKKIIVEAGRVSTGYFKLFEGDIVSCVPSQPPDIMLTFKAKTGQFQKGNVIAKSNAAQSPMRQIATEVSKDLALSLIFEATDKNIANYSYTGAALKQVEKLAQLGNVNAYVDDSNLIVKNWNAPLQGVSHILSSDSGMIGIPEATEQGVQVTSLLDPNGRLGGNLQIASKINPALNGSYTIFKLSYVVTNRDTPFYTVYEGKRPSYPNRLL